MQWLVQTELILAEKPLLVVLKIRDLDAYIGLLGTWINFKCLKKYDDVAGKPQKRSFSAQ